MGRNFECLRMGVKNVSARWLKASKALKKEDQIYGQKLAEMAKTHSNEAFYAIEDPLEGGHLFRIGEPTRRICDTAEAQKVGC